MSDLCLLFHPQDAQPAGFLLEKFANAGVRAVAADAAPGAMEAARLVVALWSPQSIGAEAMIAAAAGARAAGKLIHARMLGAPSPAAYAADPAIDLTGWRGEDLYPAWRRLLGEVQDRFAAPPPSPPAAPPPLAPEPVLAASPAPAAAPEHPPAAEPIAMSTPEPVRPAPTPPPAPPPPPEPVSWAPPPRPPVSAPSYPPPPRAAPKGGGGGLVVALVIGALVLLGLAAGGTWLWVKHQAGEIALFGERAPPGPTPETQAAWDGMDRTDAAALRAFLADAANAPLAEEARNALDQLEVSRFEAAMAATDPAVLRAFLRDFPDSPRAVQATARLDSLLAAGAQVPPSLTRPVGPLLPPLEDPSGEPPPPPPAAQPQPQPQPEPPPRRLRDVPRGEPAPIRPPPQDDSTDRRVEQMMEDMMR